MITGINQYIATSMNCTLNKAMITGSVQRMVTSMDRRRMITGSIQHIATSMDRRRMITDSTQHIATSTGTHTRKPCSTGSPGLLAT